MYYSVFDRKNEYGGTGQNGEYNATTNPWMSYGKKWDCYTHPEIKVDQTGWDSNCPYVLVQGKYW
jgi:hypothetical protein